MRIACGLAIALWLSFPAVGVASWRQDPASSANAVGQGPAVPATTKQPPAETKPAPANPQTPAPETKASEGVTKKKTATHSARGTRKRRKRSASAPNGVPRKIVVREGGASEPAAQIVPGMTPAEATRQHQNAEHMLNSTDDELKQLAGRTLDAQQRETVGQIRNYMEGAGSALKEGDVRRANTLAQKAHLLAEDLVKY
jgi:hypothetical protein